VQAAQEGRRANRHQDCSVGVAGDDGLETQGMWEAVMLSGKDNKIFTLFSKRIRERFPDARLWAFGSRVKGRATQESDLDVCVVLDTLDDVIDQAIMNIAWEVGFENDMVISTVTYSRQEFDEGPCSESPLVQNILEAGVAA